MSRDIPNPTQLGAPRTTLDRARAYQLLQEIHGDRHHDLEVATGLTADQADAALGLLTLPSEVRYGLTVGHITETQGLALLVLTDEWYIITGYNALCNEPHTEEQLAELVDRMQSLKKHATAINKGIAKIDESAEEMARFGEMVLAASPEERGALLEYGFTVDDLHFFVKLARTPDPKTRREMLFEQVWQSLKAQFPDLKEPDDLEDADKLSEA